MTIRLWKPASLTPMQHHARLIAAALFFLSLASAPAEEPSLRDLLRDGLYAEEVARDPEAAAKQYEQLLARFTEQRDFAASALFRLAEVRRKQDRKDDAIQLYQRLIAEFPGSATETKLARENLTALGGKLPEVKGPAADPESLEIARLESLAKTAPDIILDPDMLSVAAEKGWSRVVAYLMAAGSQPYVGNALYSAAREGYLEIVKQLMAGDAPVPADKATDAIWAAMEADRYTILEFLLQKDLKPEKKDGITALTKALLEGKMRASELLVKYKIDLDETSGGLRTGPYKPSGTALAIMIYEEKFDAADWLLAKGAKPDVAEPILNISALHYAALGKTERSFAMMQRLLEAGADPNRSASDFSVKNSTLQSREGQGRVLLAAILSEYKIEEKMRLLLKHKADPNAEFYHNNQGPSLLDILIYNTKEEEVEKCLPLLIEAGAKPDKKWTQMGFQGLGDNVRDALIGKFTIPEFFKDSEIQLLINHTSHTNTHRIAVRSQEGSPPDLGAWLLANHQNYQWESSRSDDSFKYQWLIWRKTGDGVFTKQELDFSNNAAFPPLQWGDILESRLNVSGPNRPQIEYQEGLSPEIITSLRKRISFPITFEIEGKTRELTLRGDRIFFDPTKNEVPLGNLQSVVERFWQMPGGWASTTTIHVSRKGWPDVRLSYGSKEAIKFQLEAGDRVKLEISDEVRKIITLARKQTVTLKVDRYPFSKFFGKHDDDEPVAASIPTLIQILTEAQCPPCINWSELVTIKSLGAAKFAELYEFFDGFTLLPYPDLSSIRIRRLQEDGSEKVIEVNLSKVIAAATDQTTTEEARKADVMLQIGDVVEVSLIKENLDKPWKGLSRQEEAFFAKALSGRVQVTDQEGNLSVRDLVFKAPDFIETKHGWIPMPPETGMPSSRGWWLEKGTTMDIKRGEIQAAKDQSSYDVFLRDGDEISKSRDSRVRLPRAAVIPPQPQMQPRARVVPPPPSR